MALGSERELIIEALPGYELGPELGRGAWGVVYEGTHRNLARAVAIKQLPRAFAADEAVRKRFLAEARTVASLDHPHIVPVYDYVEHEGLCLMVMERCESSLADRFFSEGISADEACSAVMATCAALQHAHSRNVLHRDIKPENLMYDTNGVLQLGDFGIARTLDGSERLTTTGMVVGTPAYMSPEQAAGEDVGPYSDVYSVGVLLYELLSGALPFAGAKSIGALIRSHMTEEPKPLAEVAPDVPAPLAAAVDRALAKSPADRYQSAEEFGMAIAAASTAGFGPGWLRRRGFTLLGATDMLAATERPSVIDTVPAAPAGDGPGRSRSPGTVILDPGSPPPPPPGSGAADASDGSGSDRAPEGDGDRGGSGPPLWRRPMVLGGVALAVIALVGFLVLGGGDDKPSGVAAPGALPSPGTAGTAAIVHSFTPAVGTSIEEAATAVNEAGGLGGARFAVGTVGSPAEIDAGTKLVVGPPKAAQLEATLAAVGPGTTVIFPGRSNDATAGTHIELEAPPSGVAPVVANLLPAEVSRLTIVAPRRQQIDASLVDALVSALELRNTDVSFVNPELASPQSNVDAILATQPEAILFVGTDPDDETYDAMLTAGLSPSTMTIIAISDEPGSARFDQGQLAGMIAIGKSAGSVSDQAYDAVVIYALSVRSAGSEDPADVVRAAVAVTADGTRCTDYASCRKLMDEGTDIDFDGRGGTYALGPDGRPTEATYVIRRIGDTGLPDPDLDQNVFVSVP